MTKYVITQEQLNSVARYLQTKPLGEVLVLWNALNALPRLEQPETEKLAEKPKNQVK